MCGEESSVDQSSIDSFFTKTWPALKKTILHVIFLVLIKMGLSFRTQPLSMWILKGGGEILVENAAKREL